LLWPMQQILMQSQILSDSDKLKLIEETAEAIIPTLSREAAKLPLAIDSELSLDWFNGRRTPDANQWLTATITGLSLGSDAVTVFRSIVEATCFGAKAIVERFEEQGIPVKGLIGIGGVAKKSPFIMQMMADVMDMPIRIHRSEQTCALGAAMFAATAAGIYPKVEDAMEAMGQGFDAIYHPDAEKVELYAARYQRYKVLGNFIETQTSNLISQ